MSYTVTIRGRQFEIEEIPGAGIIAKVLNEPNEKFKFITAQSVKILEQGQPGWMGHTSRVDALASLGRGAKNRR